MGRLPRRLALFLTVALLLTVMAVPAGAQGTVVEVEPLTPPPSAETGRLTDETPAYWFVEFSNPPVVEGTALSDVRVERARFRAEARRASVEYEERFAFETLWNGVSVRVDRENLTELAKLPGIRAIYPVEVVSLPYEGPFESPDLATALGMTGADIAQSELGLTGEGIKVGVIDSGIDYLHPDLGGCFGPECKVAFGFDFVGDDYNAADPENDEPRPDEDPMDCGGHGTHVAGIVGARAADEGGVTGVAPDVTLGAYRVFGCAGSSSADVILAALERALADEMDVVNMSLGASFQWPQYPTAQASNRLVSQGVTVIASMGNSGANGIYSGGAPGVGERVIAVASFDNTAISAQVFEVDQTGAQVAYLPMANAPEPPTEGTSPEVVYIGRACNTDELLDDPEGKIALSVRGDCTFNEKYQNAVQAGAAGVIIMNNLPGIFSGGGIVSRDVFAIGISQEDGQAILELIESGDSVTINWMNERTNAPNPTGGLISSFSSYGLAPDLTLKPDIGAPGGLIRSTYPRALGAYTTLSGTSMSAPHVAGAVALLLEARPNTSPQTVRELLMNSADPQVWSLNPGLGFLDHTHRQGAGMLDITSAISAETRISPVKLSLGESQAGPSVQRLTLTNTSATTVTYTVSHEPALSTGENTFAPSFFTGFATVEFNRDEVVVPAGGRAVVSARITANQGLLDGSIYGGYLVFTPDDGGQTYRVPYAGFKGDYQALRVLQPTPAGFPWLARLEGNSYTRLPEGGSFTFQDGDVPYFLLHLAHPARSLRFEVIDANNGRIWGRGLQLDYLPRSATSTGFIALPWDGTFLRGNQQVELPNGRYNIVVVAQKALGSPNNPNHYERWTSPVIEIERP